MSKLETSAHRLMRPGRPCATSKFDSPRAPSNNTPASRSATWDMARDVARAALPRGGATRELLGTRSCSSRTRSTTLSGGVGSRRSICRPSRRTCCCDTRREVPMPSDPIARWESEGGSILPIERIWWLSRPGANNPPGNSATVASPPENIEAPRLENRMAPRSTEQASNPHRQL